MRRRWHSGSAPTALRKAMLMTPGGRTWAWGGRPPPGGAGRPAEAAASDSARAATMPVASAPRVVSFPCRWRCLQRQLTATAPPTAMAPAAVSAAAAAASVALAAAPAAAPSLSAQLARGAVPPRCVASQQASLRLALGLSSRLCPPRRRCLPLALEQLWPCMLTLMAAPTQQHQVQSCRLHRTVDTALQAVARPECLLWALRCRRMLVQCHRCRSRRAAAAWCQVSAAQAQAV